MTVGYRKDLGTMKLGAHQSVSIELLHRENAYIADLFV